MGADSADLQMKIARKDTAWCGADALLDSRACGIQISPFKRSLVGIKAVTAGEAGASELLERAMHEATLPNILQTAQSQVGHTSAS